VISAPVRLLESVIKYQFVASIKTSMTILNPGAPGTSPEQSKADSTSELRYDQASMPRYSCLAGEECTKDISDEAPELLEILGIDSKCRNLKSDSSNWQELKQSGKEETPDGHHEYSEG